MDEFKNKNAFITGAASGIGRSFALALANLEMNLLLKIFMINWVILTY